MTLTSNDIPILYNTTIRYCTYGGLYFSLFLFVAIISGVKTYQTEKHKLVKRKNAFLKKPGAVQSKGAPIASYRDVDCRGLKKEEPQKYSDSRPVPLKMICDEEKEEEKDTTQQPTTDLSMDQDAPTAIPLSIPVSSHSFNEHDDSLSSPSPTTKDTLITPIATVTEEDDGDDDYQSKWSYKAKQPQQRCFCHEFCYILCATDFRKNWLKDAWILRSVYGSVIVYISDYITDLNILILWSIDGYNQYAFGIEPANGLNMVLMATCCLCVLLFYKIISGIAVWKATGSCGYGTLQFLDVYVFVEVYRSHRIGKKTDRLRWLSNLESVFEASPQVLLQLVFLMQSTKQDNNSYPIVLLGLFFSVVKLGITAINNDSVHVINDANVVKHYKFWLRSLFRITELTATEFTYVLMWLVIGEKFLLMVIIVKVIHNTLLYYGGCLSRQIFNIFGHIMALAQLSYTIVEGIPIKLFLRGNLHENDPDYPNDTRSKLQFPYSIFIRRYNMAKNANHARIETQRRKREEQSKENKTKRRKDLNVTLSPISADHQTESLDAAATQPGKGELIVNPWSGMGCEADEADLLGLNDALQLAEIEKYKTSIGGMTGLYSYCTWIHSAIIWYLNVYLSSQRPQQIMMIERTISGVCCLIIIGIYGAQVDSSDGVWKSASHRFVSFFDVGILVMYLVSFVFTLLSMLFFWLMMENDIINEVKKKEEIQFRTIFDAIYYGRLDAIINQFDARIHLQSVSTEGKSALYYACELSQIDIAEWLIGKAIVDINSGATQNRSPLYIACRVGCFEIVSRLLDEPSCDYNACTDAGRSPLYAACREGHDQIASELLCQPLIEVNALTLNSSCALSAACQNGWTDIVIELLRKPEIEINVLNNSNYTPIFIAALGKHTECVQLLLKRPEIDIDRGAKNDESLFYVCCERGMHEIVSALIDRDGYNVDVNKANAQNYTPLYIAACFGHASIIKILMECDQATLNQPDNIGRTPFFVAVRKGHAEAVFELLQYDDIDIHAKDHDELTPFAAACQGGSVVVVEALMGLVGREEIIGVDRLKRTPFFMAAREGQTAVVERLMLEDNIIDINQADKLARTPLMVAVKRAHDECVASLCRNEAIDINQTDHQMRSPLFIAAKGGPSHANTINSLMSRNDLLINAKAMDGKTALLIACELGHSSIVMLLLDHADIDVNEPDDTGTSPLAIAHNKLDNNVYMRMVMISMGNEQ